MVCLVLAVVSVGARPRSELVPIGVGDQVELEGTIDLYGNEPRTFVAILVMQEDNPDFIPTGELLIVRGEDAPMPTEFLFRLAGDLVDRLSRLQRSTVRIVGTFVEPAVGPGFPAVIEVESFVVVGP